MTVVLDSWAVITMLDRGPGAERVAEILDERPVMSWINLGEVLYILTRRHGSSDADEAIRDLRGVLSVRLPTVGIVAQAAAIKAAHRMSYADAFAAATAVSHDAELWTGDPELLVDDVPWQAVDLRS